MSNNLRNSSMSGAEQAMYRPSLKSDMIWLYDKLLTDVLIWSMKLDASGSEVPKQLQGLIDLYRDYVRTSEGYKSMSSVMGDSVFHTPCGYRVSWQELHEIDEDEIVPILALAKGTGVELSGLSLEGVRNYLQGLGLS